MYFFGSDYGCFQR